LSCPRLRRGEPEGGRSVPAVSFHLVSVVTPTVSRHAADRWIDRVFYTSMAIAVFAVVFVGFAPTYYLRLHFQTTPLPLYLHLHGLAFTAWIGLFAAQTMLVAARRIDVHRRFGWAGAALAVVMVVVAITAAILSGRRAVAAGHEDEALTFLTTPFLAMVVFTILVGGAIYYRRRTETHKRLMLLATISLLDAAVARWPIDFVATSAWALYVLTDLFIVAAVLYDLASRRRVHPVYLWGSALILAGQSLRTVIGQTEMWHAIARAILR
jgi:hypothetical protein